MRIKFLSVNATHLEWDIMFTQFNLFHVWFTNYDSNIVTMECGWLKHKREISLMAVKIKYFEFTFVHNDKESFIIFEYTKDKMMWFG